MDPRFSTQNDPRFKRLPGKLKKTKLDERFKTILHDPSFTTEVDPRSGKRKVSKTNQLHLKNLYTSDEPEGEKKKHGSFEKAAELDDEIQSEDLEQELESCSFSYSASESDVESEIMTSSLWDTHESSIPMSPESSNRLAILGCDWSCVSSQDLYFLLSSFAEPVGKIQRVAIYTSEFGEERLAEEKKGPKLALHSEKNQKKWDISQTNHQGDMALEQEDEEKLTEAIRKYEKERSRYYFAVAECDTKETANYLYNELEGLDCDFTIDQLDLRFIPDDLPAFTHTYPRPPKCVCTNLPLRGYAPGEQFISALKHSKPKLMWDETPQKRVRFFRKRFTASEMEDLDIKDYLASSSSDVHSSAEDEDPVEPDHVIFAASSIEGIELPHGSTVPTEPPSDSSRPYQDEIDAYRQKLLGEDAHSMPGTSKNHHPTSSTTSNIDIELFVPSIPHSKEHDTTDKSSKNDSWMLTKLTQRRKTKNLQNDKISSTMGSHPLDKKTQPLMDSQTTSIIKSSKKENSFVSETKPEEFLPTTDETDDLFTLSPVTYSGNKKSSTKRMNKKKHKKEEKKKQELENETTSLDFTKDERFQNLLTHPEFAVDPTHPKFKMSKTYEKLLVNKAKKKPSYL